MAHGSPSCWLWMLSSFKVWLLYLAFFGPEWSRDSVFLFLLFLFIFILTLDYIDHVVQANFLQKKDNKKEIYGKYIQIVLCNKGNMQIFFFLINKILLMLNCWEYGMLY